MRCAIAPYCFRARTKGGAMLLEPLSADEAAALAAGAGVLADEKQPEAEAQHEPSNPHDSYQ